MKSSYPVIVGLIAFAGSASAQTITPLALEGDNIFGIGGLTGLESIAVNDAGQWILELDTNNVTTTIDSAIVYGQGGVMQGIVQQEGQTVVSPAGASATLFTSRSMRPNGDAAYIWTVAGGPVTAADNVRVFFNNSQDILKKGDTPLAAGWGLGTVHNGLSWATLNANNQILLRGFANDPTNAITNDWFASVIQLDGAHLPISEVLLARAGQVLPPLTFGINTVGSGQDAGFINASGQVIYRISLTGAPTGADSAVVFWNGSGNTVIAAEGSPSPVGGRNWGDIGAPELAINDAGDWLIKEKLDSTSTATDEFIAKNGTKFVQEGDFVPASLGVWKYTTFNNTPVSLTASGSVCWYGDWDNTNTAVDTAIFLDQTVLVQKGVTLIGTDTLNAIGCVGSSATAAQNGSFYISPNGRFLIFTGRLATANKRGIFLLDRGFQSTSFCSGDGTDTTCPCANPGLAGRGCDNTFATGGAGLADSGRASVGSDTFKLTGTNAIPFGPGLYYEGSTTANPTAPFGVVFGNGLRCAGGVTNRLEIVFADGFGASSTSVALGAFGGAVAGSTYNYQLWYRDTGDVGICVPGAGFNFSSALSKTWTP